MLDEFQMFRDRIERNYGPVVPEQVGRCLLHLGTLEANMPDPGSVLIRSAWNDFIKLEQMGIR